MRQNCYILYIFTGGSGAAQGEDGTEDEHDAGCFNRTEGEAEEKHTEEDGRHGLRGAQDARHLGRDVLDTGNVEREGEDRAEEDDEGEGTVPDPGILRPSHLPYAAEAVYMGLDDRDKAIFDGKTVHINDLMSHLLSTYNVKDINIAEPDIESIIRKIYSREKVAV